MSDATLPSPRSSSAAPAIEAGLQSDASSGEGPFDAILGQPVGDDTKEETSGDSEGRTESKQKRKRTSPADQAVLEAAFKQNPKPSAEEKARTLKLVSMSEKAVQIWFQNRRQISRRKSRPLLPHEIAAFGLRGMTALSSDPVSGMAFSSGQDQEETGPQGGVSSSQEVLEDRQNEVEVLPKQLVTPAKRSGKEHVGILPDDANVSLPPLLQCDASGISKPEQRSVSSTESPEQSFSSTPGYIANRWNTVNPSFSTPASSQIATFPAFTTPPVYNFNQPASCPERINKSATTPSSRVRLSLGLDGKAELVASNSPSPPRQHAPLPLSFGGSLPPPMKRIKLQRSQSAMSFSPRTTATQADAPAIPRLSSSRSSDARAWEFCCHSEARDELSIQAENESNGSACAAIRLIRSASNKALKSNSNKRNSPATRPNSNAKREKLKLERAASSFARLQTSQGATTNESQDPSNFSKDGIMRSPSGDSDKENWVPHEAGGGNPRRRPLPSGRSDKQKPASKIVLGDNHTILSHAGNLGGGRNRKRKPTNSMPDVYDDGEDARELPEEVSKFMRGSISPSKKGDLDCVQGLLSLSQGNWR